MRGPKAVPLRLSEEERSVLEKLVHRPTGRITRANCAGSRRWEKQ
jgi:hypothetical protein